MRHQAIAKSLLVSLVVVACADDPSKPSDHLQIYETCLETQCARDTQSGNDACSACESACFAASYDCDPTTACSDSCSPRECSGDNACVQQGYKVTLPNNPNPAIADACSQALAQISTCGGSTTSSCSAYAAVDRDIAVGFFQCVAQLDCGSLTNAGIAGCFSVQPSTFGDDLCAQLASTCQPCSSDTQAALDADGAILRQDALDAAMMCLSQPSCDETSSCLSVWRGTVE